MNRPLEGSSRCASSTEQQALQRAKEDKAAREADYEELNRAPETSSDEALALTASLQEHKDQAAEEIKRNYNSSSLKQRRSVP